MSRIVRGLVWARQAAGRPPGMPIGRPRGAKAAGLRYERAVAAALPQARHGLWWEFCDAAGPGWCQTDLVLLGRDGALVLECKYTYNEKAWEQLELLYLPVLTQALQRPVLGVQVCRVLLPHAGTTLTTTLRDAVELAGLGRRTTLHWTGVTGLGPGGTGASPRARFDVATEAHAD